VMITTGCSFNCRAEAIDKLKLAPGKCPQMAEFSAPGMGGDRGLCLVMVDSAVLDLYIYAEE